MNRARGTGIVGIGIDLVETVRLEAGAGRPAFLRRAFTPVELAAPGLGVDRMARTMALKECFMKALGAGIRQGLWFTDVEVLWSASGEPSVRPLERAARAMRQKGARSIRATSSCAGGLALGVVTLER